MPVISFAVGPLAILFGLAVLDAGFCRNDGMKAIYVFPPKYHCREAF